MPIDADIQARQKKMWTVGDFPTVAERIIPVSELAVERVGVEPGLSLLDVATGTGNLAMIAAQAGAKVTGVDITPKLLEVGRERAKAAGLEIEFSRATRRSCPSRTSRSTASRRSSG